MTFLCVMVAPPGAGKSTWLKSRFPATGIVCLDTIRGWCTDNESDQTVNDAAVDIQRMILTQRLARRRPTAVDSTNITADRREPLLQLARRYYIPTVAVVLDTPLEVCHANNDLRDIRHVPPTVIERHWHALHDDFPEPAAVPGFDVTRWISPDRDRVFVDLDRLPAEATSWACLH